MKTRIRGDKTEPDTVVDFWLERDDDGDISLMTESTDAEDGWAIAVVKAGTGELELCRPLVTECLRLASPLNSEGSIVTIND